MSRHFMSECCLSSLTFENPCTQKKRTNKTKEISRNRKIYLSSQTLFILTQSLLRQIFLNFSFCGLLYCAACLCCVFFFCSAARLSKSWARVIFDLVLISNGLFCVEIIKRYIDIDWSVKEGKFNEIRHDNHESRVTSKQMICHAKFNWLLYGIDKVSRRDSITLCVCLSYSQFSVLFFSGYYAFFFVCVNASTLMYDFTVHSIDGFILLEY